jgi:outer membrane protein assembly factor BamD
MSVRFDVCRQLLALLLLALLGACSTLGSGEDAAQSAEKLYADAKEDMAGGAWDRAIKTLEKVEGRASGTLLAQQAVLDLAYAQWKSGEKVSAIASLDRFIKLYPSSPALDYALYLKGTVNFNENTGFLSSFSRQDIAERDQQASRDSYQAYQQLLDQFPASKYVPDARLRMAFIVNALAAHEVFAARYYYRRGAFLAAANRAAQVVRVYPRAPVVEEALYIMAVSYEQLGLAELRDDADRVLKLNYPNSAHLRDGIRAPEKTWWQFW